MSCAPVRRGRYEPDARGKKLDYSSRPLAKGARACVVRGVWCVVWCVFVPCVVACGLCGGGVEMVWCGDGVVCGVRCVVWCVCGGGGCVGVWGCRGGAAAQIDFLAPWSRLMPPGPCSASSIMPPITCGSRCR
eukprot:scaffold454_cov43-Phaeocystis_antarctica.AAC.1